MTLPAKPRLTCLCLSMLLLALVCAGCERKEPRTELQTVAAASDPATAPPAEAARAPVAAPASSPSAQPGPREYTTTGPLVVDRQATLFAERDGRLSALRADLGDHVHRGQVLALLDDRAAQADVEAKTARVASLRAQLHEWQAEQRGAEADMRRSDSLFQSRIISEEEVEHQRSRLEQTVAEVSRYKLDGDAADADLRGARIALEASEVIAPFDGVVARRSVSPGQQVKKGQELFWVTAEAPLHVVFTVPESSMLLFRRGASLELSSTDTPGLRQPARVAQVSPVVDPASGSIEVNAVLEHPSPLLKPGMSMQIRLAPQ